MDTLQDKLRNYVLDPKNPTYNFQLAKAYEDIYHTASAAGYYLRAAEFSRDDLEIYEALLRMAMCFQAQGNRVFTVTGLLMRAIALVPYRPEGYFLLSEVYEHNRDWQEAYTFAVLGEEYSRGNHPPLKTNVRYQGAYLFAFEKAIAGWWLGLHDESMYLFRQLRDNPEVDLDHLISVKQNLEKLETAWQSPMLYTEDGHERLRIKFPGSEKIKKNFSQCYQDLFVLTMTDGTTDGTYLEIGSADPWYGSNTALLEKFGWEGVSVEVNPVLVESFGKQRRNKVTQADATRVDFMELITPGDLEYLQIDCDPAQTSLEVLFNIPFHRNRFAVITFEHDHYLDESKSVRQRSREYLRSLGYKLVLGDISVNDFDSFEDWWIHPELMSDQGRELLKYFVRYNSYPNRADKCMFN